MIPSKLGLDGMTQLQHPAPDPLAWANGDIWMQALCANTRLCTNAGCLAPEADENAGDEGGAWDDLKIVALANSDRQLLEDMRETRIRCQSKFRHA